MGFQFLSEKVGYTICALERKGYTDPAVYDTFKCRNCGYANKVKILPETKKLKSNVDVYLASDMVELAAKMTEPVHAILMSCDGDYAEAIKAALRVNPQIYITIMATPMTKKNNSLSSRLQIFATRSFKNTALVNIASIKDKISQELSNPLSK
ncbi:NYN domain-containing protein [Candidatus Saccharibacteria bacterium]|nr:NYN domain-containing protein [Candidatus Saccharibacteria bacterium]